MFINKYFCDNCNEEVKNHKELKQIFLQVTLDDRIPSISKEICNKCMCELGFIEPKNSENYIQNYSHFLRSWFSIVKKIFK